jgi:hypothetical protein
MKRCVLWLWIVLLFSTTAAGGILLNQPWFAFDEPFSLWYGLNASSADWLAYFTQNNGLSSPGVRPRLQLTNSLLSGVGHHAGGIAEVTITPAVPKPWDEVSLTVSGYKPFYFKVDRAESRVSGAGQISVAVYWLDTRLIPGSGFGLVEQPYQITVPLGTFDPGRYLVLLTYRGAMTNSVTTHFTVVP